MIGIVHVDALVVEVRAVGLHRVGAVEHHVARAGARACTASRIAESFTPFHLRDRAPAFDAIVAGDLRARRERAQFREREDPRLADQTGDRQAIIGEAIGGHRVDTRRVPGLAVPLLRNCGERSDSANSCAIALRAAMACAARRFNRSARPSTLGNHSLLRQAVAAGQEQCRRSRGGTRDKAAARRGDAHSWTGLRCHAIAAGDHRPQVVPESGDDHLEHVDQHEGRPAARRR